MKSKNFLAISISLFLTFTFLSCSSSRKSAVPCPEFTKYKSDYTTVDHKKNKKSIRHQNNVQLRNRNIASLRKKQINDPALIRNSSSELIVQTDYLFQLNKTDFTAGLIASVDNSIMPLVTFVSDNVLEKSEQSGYQKVEPGILPKECDTIMLKSGVTLIGKVEEIKQKEITYRKCNNLTGPLISILKSDVIKIDYANGTHEVLAAEIIDDDVYTHDKDVFVKNDSPVVKIEGLGVAGFVSSVVGLFVAGVILGMVGIIFGSISLRNIKRNPDRLKGRGLAIAAIILGVIAVIGALIVISAM